MAGSVGRGPGGIAGLVGLLNEHGEAVEYDLLRLGLHIEWLGTPRLTWRDLQTVITQAPADSAIVRATMPAAIFGATDRLLLLIELRIRQLAWSLGGQKGPAPQLIDLPGDETRSQASDPDSTTWRPEPVTIDEMNARLGWR